MATPFCPHRSTPPVRRSNQAWPPRPSPEPDEPAAGLIAFEGLVDRRVRGGSRGPSPVGRTAKALLSRAFPRSGPHRSPHLRLSSQTKRRPPDRSRRELVSPPPTSAGRTKTRIPRPGLPYGRQTPDRRRPARPPDPRPPSPRSAAGPLRPRAKVAKPAPGPPTLAT
jgi:hypothetical protein